MDKPMSIVVDPVAGYLFWTDRGRTPKIERARLDGTDRRVLVNESIFFMTGLTLDLDKGHVYWCDSRLDTLERIDYDGTNRVTLLDKAHLENPQGLSLFGDRLYWIDASLKGGAILSAPLSNVSDYAVVVSQTGESLKDIKVTTITCTHIYVYY